MIRQTLSICIILFLFTATLPFTVISFSPTHKDDASKNNPLLFSSYVHEINESKIRFYHDKLMSFGPRYTGSENCSDAGDWIYSAFSSMDLSVEFHDWDYAGFTSRNIVATIPGTSHNSSIEYLLTAHYDCTPNSLGANDDGSGIAAILTIAETLSQFSFPYTIRFIAFSGEEVGTFGSFSYAKDAYRRGDNIRAVLNPDMIGYADTQDGGRTLRFFYPKRSEWIATFAQKVAKSYDEIIDMNIDALPNYIGADHQPFVDYGYDGVWIAHQDAYQWANTPEDDPEHLNFSYLTKATKLLLAVIAELAFTNVQVSVQLTEPYEGYGYLKNNPLVPLDLGKQWYWGLRGITVLVGSAQAKAIVESKDSIRWVIFCFDNNFVYWDSKHPYEWNIQGKHAPLIGKHTIRVYAYTTTGLVATDEMDVFSLSIKCQYN